MNRHACLCFSHSFAVVHFTLMVLLNILRDCVQRNGTPLNKYAPVWHDIPTGMCGVDGIVVNGTTGMLFSAVTIPALTVNRTKGKSR